MAEAHAGPLQASALPLGYGAVSRKLASYLDFLNCHPLARERMSARNRSRCSVISRIVAGGAAVW